MECNQCLKQLNEMTIVCDRCGTILSKDKQTLYEDDLEKLIVLDKEEDLYPSHLQEDIKKAYFLSLVRNEVKDKRQRKRIDEFIHYIYLRVMYQRDKDMLLTPDYSIPKAKTILTSLVNRSIHTDLLGYMQEEFPEDFDNKTIPFSVMNKVEKIYITDYKLGKLLPKKDLTSMIFTSISYFIKYTLIIVPMALAIIAGYLFYQGQDITTISTQIISYISTQPNLVVMVAGSILILSILRALFSNQNSLFSFILKQNKSFNRYVQVTCTKRLKTLQYRIKKGKKK